MLRRQSIKKNQQTLILLSICELRGHRRMTISSYITNFSDFRVHSVLWKTRHLYHNYLLHSTNFFSLFENLKSLWICDTWKWWEKISLMDALLNEASVITWQLSSLMRAEVHPSVQKSSFFLFLAQILFPIEL